MSDLRPPATGTEAYLEAILGELRVIRVALGDGLPGLAAIDKALGDVADAVQYVDGGVVAPAAPKPPVKRTRTRTREMGNRGG